MLYKTVEHMDEENLNTMPSGAYVSDYRAHLVYTAGHLTGHSPGAKPHRPSIHPTSFDGGPPAHDYSTGPPVGAAWSAAEKDLFFHALGVHSRLRPDLIAESIGSTKSVLDVYAYLCFLEAGKEKLLLKEAGGNLKQTTALGTLRARFPIALEVTDAWVSHEKSQASGLAGVLPVWEQVEVSKVRAKQVDAEVVKRLGPVDEPESTVLIPRKNGRKRKKVDTAEETAIRKGWKTVCERQDALESLDAVAFQVLTSLLRKDEAHHLDAFTGLAETPEDSIPPGTPPLPPTPNETSMYTATQATQMSTISDDMIDPALRAPPPPPVAHVRSRPLTPNAIAGPSTFPGSASTSSTHSSFSFPRPPYNPTTQSHAGPQGSIVPLRDASVVTSTVPHFPPRPESRPQSTELPLSPKSRRRIQKAMYMRRKRAEATGAEVSEVVGKLKPGRKPKERPAVKKGKETKDATPSVGPGFQDEHVDENEEDEGDDDDVRFPNPGGLTRPYKLKRMYAELGLDAEHFRFRGLGLISLNGLVKIHKIFSASALASMNDDDEHEAPESSSQEFKSKRLPFVSGSSVSLMHALVVSFTTKVMSRMAAIYDHHMNHKTHTKLWKIRFGEAGRVQVLQALDVLGIANLHPKQLLEELAEQLGFDGEEVAEQEDEEEDEDQPPRKKRKTSKPESEPGDEDDEGEEPVKLFDRTATHRDIFKPMIRLPLELFARPRYPVGGPVFHTQDFEVPSFYARDPLNAYEPLLPEDDDSESNSESEENAITNEEAARIEIEEDDRLDEIDVQAEEQAERVLWRESAGTKEPKGVGKRKKHADSLAFAPAGTGTVKSAVYVDSDTD